MRKINVAYLIILSIVYSTLVSANKEELTNEFNGQLFSGVMKDSYSQFEYLQKRNSFVLNDAFLEKDFFNSFAKQKYQGSVSLELGIDLDYVIDQAIIYWEEAGSNSKKVGSLDMNEFLKATHPNLIGGENKFLCGGACVGGIGIAVGGLVCAIVNSNCTARCTELPTT